MYMLCILTNYLSFVEALASRTKTRFLARAQGQNERLLLVRQSSARSARTRVAQTYKSTGL